MSRAKRQGERLWRALSCLALLGSAACTSAGAVKLTGPTRIVSGVTAPNPAATETTPECAALQEAAFAPTPTDWPTFADPPVPTSCDALGRALGPELTTRMSHVLARSRDDYLLAACQGAAPGQHPRRTTHLVMEYGLSLTQRWSPPASGQPAMTQKSGQFLYVAAHGTLQTLDLSQPSAPRVVARAALDGERTQLLVQGHRLLAIARVHAEARPAYCEPGAACDFTEDRGTLLSLFEIGDRAQPRLLEQLALSGDFAYGAIVGSVAHLVTDDTASNRLGLRFEPSPPAAGAQAVRRAMAELQAQNSLAIAQAAPAARLPGISRRAASGAFAPFEPSCSAYTVTHGTELQSILSFDLETGTLARTLLEAPFGGAKLVLGELALEPPRRANPDRDVPASSYRFSLSRGSAALVPHALAPHAPSPPAPKPAVQGVEAAIPLDPSHTLLLRLESTSLTIGDAHAIDSRVLVRVLGDEPQESTPNVPEASVLPPSDPLAWSAQSYSFGYFPAQRLLAVTSDPYVPTTDIAQQSPSVLNLFAVSTRAVTPLAVIRHAPFALPRTDEPRPEVVFLERGRLFDVTEEALYVWNPARPTVSVTRVPLTAAP